jgi:DMSO reductase anchor subunit
MLLETGRRHVLAPPLRLHVAVGERLLWIHPHVGHVTRRHVALRHAGPGLLGREVGTGWLFGGVDGVSIVHAVVAGRRFGSVQAGLGSVLVERRGCMGHPRRCHWG